MPQTDRTLTWKIWGHRTYTYNYTYTNIYTYIYIYIYIICIDDTYICVYITYIYIYIYNIIYIYILYRTTIFLGSGIWIGWITIDPASEFSGQRNHPEMAEATGCHTLIYMLTIIYQYYNTYIIIPLYIYIYTYTYVYIYIYTYIYI